MFTECIGQFHAGSLVVGSVFVIPYNLGLAYPKLVCSVDFLLFPTISFVKWPSGLYFAKINFRNVETIEH